MHKARLSYFQTLCLYCSYPQKGLEHPRMSKTRKTFLTLASFGISGMIAGLVFGIALFYFFGRDLPDYSKLVSYKPAGTTRLYAANGQMITEYATQKRIYLPFEYMPRRVIEAFISAEDQNYYHHPGIDALGILRAAWENFQNIGEGHSLVGGSTITQQVVKNFLLTREQSISRKVKEAIVAYRITRHFSKDKILELYLNDIYLGLGAYGVVAAAQEYFGKPLDALTTEEIALLAAMPKAPANYDPRFNPQAALMRRNYVLDRMYEDGYINIAEMERAKAQPVVIRERDKEKTIGAEYFAEEVRRYLMETYGMDQVYGGGLFVRTTVVPELQKLADEALRDALIAYDQRHGYRGPLGKLEIGGEDSDAWQEALAEFAKKQKPPVYDDHHLAVVLKVEDKQAKLGFLDGQEGVAPFTGMQWAARVLSTGRMGSAPRKAGDVLAAGEVVLVRPLNTPKQKEVSYGLIQVPKINGGLVVMEPQTGRVLAMSGGYDPKNDEFNRVTQAKRQPGSAFKPFVYLSALEHGFTPASIVPDEPIEIYQGPGLPMWRPKNYGNDFLGPVPLRVGLEKSRNLMTVSLAQMLGIHRIAMVGKRFGIFGDEVKENYSMVLGAVETTLMKMAAAYSAIANGGMKVQPVLIERIDDQHGKNLYRSDSRPCRGCTAESGRAVSSYAPPVLEDNRERIVDPRVAYQMISLLRGVVQRGTAASAARLGKPLGGKTGTTNDSRDAWFMGFSPDLVVGVYIGFDQPKSLGGRETGGRVALPAFIQVMETALKDKPAKGFYTPPGVQEIVIDRHTGLPPTPGLEAGPTIAETFIFGGPIFIPENEMDVMDGTLVETQEGEDGMIDPAMYDPALAQPSESAPMQQQNPRPYYPGSYNRDRYEGYRTPPSRSRGGERFGPADMGTGTLY